MEQWATNPFELVEKDGYFYGRGTSDIKDGAAILAANMIRWKREGWVPERDIIVALTADEEGGPANGVEWLLKTNRRLIDAEYCLNTDGGDFQLRDGKPLLTTFETAEKWYSDWTLETHNPEVPIHVPLTECVATAPNAAGGRCPANHPRHLRCPTAKRAKLVDCIPSGELSLGGEVTACCH